MLDHCSISHKGGIVLWSRSFTPAAEQLAASSASPVNCLVRDVLIEGRTAETTYERDGYAIKWSFVNDLELIFVVTYQRILQLTYPEDLLDAMKALFIKLFQPFLASFVASLRAAQSSAITAIDMTVFNLRTAFEGWDKLFDKLLAEFEERHGKDRHARLRSAARPAVTPAFEERASSSDSLDKLPKQSIESTHNSAEEVAMNVEAFKSRMRGRGGIARGRGRGGKKSGRGGGSAPGSDSDSNITTTKRKPEKVARKWDDSSITEKDMAELDYSVGGPPLANGSTVDVQALIDQASLGTKKNGIYEVKDWDFAQSSKDDAEEDDLISRALNRSLTNGKSEVKAATSTLGSIFARLTGSRVLTDQDLKPVLSAMKDHLMKKNVAKDISEQICEGVGETLKGKKISGFRGIRSEVQAALSTTLTRILTPKSSTDLLLSIRGKLSSATASTSSTSRVLPYSITFVGVNGVGKSTNLSKVCFWLVQNGLRVLIAACDTFRSGAVEQLRVHVRNLSMLSAKEEGDKVMVELYERGYGKDAAGIARDAISYAKDAGFDVVLIDTAGRMQDNEPLMRALAKLVSMNNPDKIIFVGEALVGNEAVDQLSKFDRSLRDFSTVAGGPGKGRGIDGMLVTKWDTVDDKVGAALSMTYVTGQPILFVGCGQTYTDLRQLKVSNVVEALLSD